MANPLTFDVLRLLADAQFHSGEAMARALGVSRANVWYALKNAGQMGITLFRVRGRGYRLAEPIDWLEADVVTHALGSRGTKFQLKILDTVDSTNSWLLREAQVGAPGGLVAAAEWQRQGKGRMGRKWHSNLGGALTFSLLWRFAQGAGALSGLSLAVSLAVARGLAAAGISGLSLKWPNDILWRRRKLAGILIEIAGDAAGPTLAVIGIGVNVRLGKKTLAEIDQAACDLSEAGCALSRSEVLARLLVALADILRVFSANGFAPLTEEWQNLHAYHAKKVTLRMPDGAAIAGTIRGTANDGSLMLETKSGVRRFYGGEISVRP